MPRYKVVDNIRSQLTAAEETARDKEEENAAKAEKEIKSLKERTVDNNLIDDGPSDTLH